MIKEFFTQRLKRGLVRRFNNFKIAGVAKQAAKQEPQPSGQPVIFFKASTGIDDLSWNSGFHLLTSWAFRLKGIPVAYFACHAGMSKCVLGTNRDNVYKEMPCKTCVSQAKSLYAGVSSQVAGYKSQVASDALSLSKSQRSQVNWFGLERDAELQREIQDLSIEQLSKFEYVVASEAKQSLVNQEIASGHTALRSVQGRTPLAMTLPLGELCLPALRWVLRIHHLNDDENTRYLLREYILSAWNVARKFSNFLDETNPRAVIVFNGQFFPEATAKYIAQKRGIRVITHEVGLQPASAFFTDGEATAYPIHIPDEFELNDEQNKKLDDYLAKRFQGDFSMAGIKFWAEMKGLDEPFLQKASRFKQIVPVFTNVIFDTSQPHANTVFEDMFDWLDLVLEVVKKHPETLFVIRAHPDELRVRKASRETVGGWVESNQVTSLPNVIYIAPNETLSSYELIQKSKFVLIYNSTIGMEAAIMGMPVLCAGKARFTQYPTVFFPQTIAEVKNKMEEFLAAEKIDVPAEFKRNARRFLYYQLYKTSLPFGDFLEPSVRTTQTKLKSFGLDELLESESVKVIVDGVLNQNDFLLKD